MTEEKNREHALVQLGQKAILIRDGKCLILEAAHQKGIYDLPGGRIENNENLDDAFHRELKEEIGLDTFVSSGVVDFDLWLRPGIALVCLVARLITNDSDPIHISNEHQSYLWVSSGDLDRYSFVFEPMKRMARKGFEYHKLLGNGK